MEPEKIADNIWKISGGTGLSSNIYLIDKVNPMLIDLGSPENSSRLIKTLERIGYKKEDIRTIIFTHLHYDHIGQPSIFPNARFFASEDDIKAFEDNPLGTAITDSAAEEIRKIRLRPLDKEISGMEVIKTPGHTIGSVCLFLKEEKILFSGDTFFGEGVYGRVDLATSVPEKMESSLKKIEKLDYKILCPGH